MRPNEDKVPISKLTRSFGAWLRARRFEQDISLNAFAETSGLSVGYLSQIENGYTDLMNLSLRRLFLLCHAYRMHPTALVKRLVDAMEIDATFD